VLSFGQKEATDRQVDKICLSAAGALFAGLCLAAVIAGCSRPSAIPTPLIPAAYYQCLAASPNDLLKAYFGHYGNRWQAETRYDDQVFVFKNVVFNDMMEQQSHNLGYIWLDGIKCVPADPGALAGLKTGARLDIVGTNRGIPADGGENWSLLMTDCYFLPSGAMVLPAEGGSTFSPGY
jgi:hypothetical protein